MANESTNSADTGNPSFWNHAASLVRRGDEGVFAELRTVRHGTLAEMVKYLTLLPENQRPQYIIEQAGGSALSHIDAVGLASRADFPGP